MAHLINTPFDMERAKKNVLSCLGHKIMEHYALMTESCVPRMYWTSVINNLLLDGKIFIVDPEVPTYEANKM
jgi:hypothetical protein